MTSKTHGSAGQISPREMAQNVTIQETRRTRARVFREENRAHLYALVGGKSQDDYLVQGKAFKRKCCATHRPSPCGR